MQTRFEGCLKVYIWLKVNFLDSWNASRQIYMQGKLYQGPVG